MTGRFMVRNRDGREVGLSSVADFKKLQERETGWSIPKQQPYGWVAPEIEKQEQKKPSRKKVDQTPDVIVTEQTEQNGESGENEGSEGE